MAMEMIGFFVRLSSSLLWFQIYRLGAAIVDTSLPRETDSDLRNSFLNPPTPAIARQCSGAEEILGGSIYDPAYYTSLFEESQTNINSPKATQDVHKTVRSDHNVVINDMEEVTHPMQILSPLCPLVKRSGHVTKWDCSNTVTTSRAVHEIPVVEFIRNFNKTPYILDDLERAPLWTMLFFGGNHK
ncbi:Hypothetical protein [Arabidopsis thaliana]|uniref:T5A14.6 protein n=1 Tax=Arabidopsis thaliana TaxID=3702 RepID=Q9ZVU9_ARATH|nr:Hypothetical protein [Arabidopsis thaliana]